MPSIPDLPAFLVGLSETTSNAISEWLRPSNSQEETAAPPAVGLETLLFVVHLADRMALHLFGASGRDALLDGRAIGEVWRCYSARTPEMHIGSQYFFEALERVQAQYGKFKLFEKGDWKAGEWLPWRFGVHMVKTYGDHNPVSASFIGNSIVADVIKALRNHVMASQAVHAD